MASIESDPVLRVPLLPEITVRSLDVLSYKALHLDLLQGDMMLDVFTHQSLRFSGAPANDDYGSPDRLVFLGRSVLEVAVASALFYQRPMLDASTLQVGTFSCYSTILKLADIPRNLLLGSGGRHAIRLEDLRLGGCLPTT